MKYPKSKAEGDHFLNYMRLHRELQSLGIADTAVRFFLDLPPSVPLMSFQEHCGEARAVLEAWRALSPAEQEAIQALLLLAERNDP